VLRHAIGMLAQAITRSLDLNDDGVMEEAIEECGGDNWVAEDLTPFGKAAVGGEDHGGALVARIDELEEQVTAASVKIIFHTLSGWRQAGHSMRKFVSSADDSTGRMARSFDSVPDV
jgi:hypothetical protein